MTLFSGQDSQTPPPSVQAVCEISIDTVTRLMGVVMPETVMVESTVLRSGRGVTVLLLKRTAGPAEPLVRLKGMLKVPLAGVVTTRSKSTLVPQRKPGPMLNWNGVVLVPRAPAAMAGYAEAPEVTETPGVFGTSVPVTPVRVTTETLVMAIL